MAHADSKSPQDSVGELLQLTKTYALQETVEPIKGLGKFIGFGLGAAVTGALGTILVLLGVLRLLQTETGAPFQGHLTWVPYLVTLFVATILIALALLGIKSKKGRTA
jgi:hypothetical protein